MDQEVAQQGDDGERESVQQITRDDWLFLFVFTMLRMYRARARRRRDVALLLYRRQRGMEALRGPYCRLQAVNPDVIAIFNNDERKTKKHIRVTPRALNLFLEHVPAKGQGWSTHFEAIVFLYWLACGSCFRVIACMFNIPRATAHSIVKRVLNDTVRMVNTIITKPTEEELEDVGRAFEDICDSPVFRRVAGAIHACQVRTLVPTEEHDQCTNQKLYYSILLQGVCDHRCRFIDIFVGLPGSVHNMRALKLSYLYRTGSYPPQGLFLLGDKSYACIQHPITVIPPYREPLTTAKRNFNSHLIQGHSVIEKTFGAMEVRWQTMFTKALQVPLGTGVKVLTACAVLHNICIAAGDVLEVDGRMVEPERLAAPTDEFTGVVFRDTLLKFHTLYRNQGHLAEVVLMDENDQ